MKNIRWHLTAVVGIILFFPLSLPAGNSNFFDSLPAKVSADQNVNPKGALIICGGGSLPADIKKRFVDLAGGSKARLVIIPSASDRVDEQSLSDKKKFWLDAGIGSVTIVHARDRKTADTAEFVKPIQNATAVWISGGQQSRLAKTYQGTATERALIELFRKGGIIGGTSAGAAIQSRIMIQSGNPEPVISSGFDLLPGAIIDQHFLRRNRFNRLLFAVRKHPEQQGVGIAEATAVLYQDQKCEVLGRSYVTLVTSKTRSAPLSIATFHAGQTFKLANNRTEPTGLIHRFSFDGESNSTNTIIDSVGKRHGRIVNEPELPFYKGSESLVVIPDTEGYCRDRPHVFDEMMQWVANQRESRDIKGLLHVGDITNDNSDVEWKNARKSFSLIDGKIPYVLAAGNHDYDNTPGRLTYMNKFFHVDEQKKWKTFGDVMERGHLENHYQLLEIQGRKWIVLSLEMGPRKKVITWANSILKKHPDRLAIILTHGFLFYNNERYDHRKGKQRATPYLFYGEGADGEMLWNQLVSLHSNVMLVVCGHVSSQYVGYRSDRTKHGNVVHQMLVDYEKLKGGGQGFLRLLEFLPDGQTVQVRTYSPLSGETRSPVTQGDSPIRDPKLEEFQFKLQFAPQSDKRFRANSQGANSQGGKRQTKPVQVPDKKRKGNQSSFLNGKGQLVISGQPKSGSVQLDPRIVQGRNRISFEVWFTPTASSYNWNPVVQFRGASGDAFYYTFRTLTKHRAELIDDHHNEDIQKTVDVKPGQRLHIVVTYEEKGTDGKPTLCSYVNGKLSGRMTTGIKLSSLDLTEGSIGRCAGQFDELRFYNTVLTHDQVKKNYVTGPEKIVIK